MAENIDKSDETGMSRRTRYHEKENANPTKNITKRRANDPAKNSRTKVLKQLNANEIRNGLDLNEEQIDYEHLYKQQFDSLVCNKLKYSTLTQQELHVLFLKYKFDQHYKPSESFATYFNKQGMANNRNYYDQFPDVQQRSGNSFDSCNQTQYMQDNAKYMSQENRKENQYPRFNENYNYSNHVYRNCDMQSYSDTNDAQNFAYSNDRIPISNEYYSCSLMNPTNISPPSCGYADRVVLYDLSNSNQLCGNSQQNDARFSNHQYNNYATNSNHDDYYSNTWNDMTTANSSCQSKNAQYYNQMEINNRNNSTQTLLHQFTKNSFEEQNSFNASNHVEPRFKYHGNFNENNIEHDLSNYTMNPFTQSEDISSIANTFNTYFTGIMDN